MEHVVFFPGADASAAFRRFASLDEALGFVEHLRNAEGVSEVSVHALMPVPLSFRAYYKVEVPGVDGLGADASQAQVPVQGEPVEVVEHVEPVEPVEPVGVPALAAVADDAEPMLVATPTGEAEPTSNGKRSLGFFAH